MIRMAAGHGASLQSLPAGVPSAIPHPSRILVNPEAPPLHSAVARDGAPSGATAAAESDASSLSTTTPPPMRYAPPMHRGGERPSPAGPGGVIPLPPAPEASPLQANGSGSGSGSKSQAYRPPHREPALPPASMGNHAHAALAVAAASVLSPPPPPPPQVIRHSHGHAPHPHGPATHPHGGGHYQIHHGHHHHHHSNNNSSSNNNNNNHSWGHTSAQGSHPPLPHGVNHGGAHSAPGAVTPTSAAAAPSLNSSVVFVSSAEGAQFEALVAHLELVDSFSIMLKTAEGGVLGSFTPPAVAAGERTLYMSNE